MDFFFAKFTVFEKDTDRGGLNLPYMTILTLNSKNLL